MNSAKTLDSELKKKIIIALLAISCLTAGIILAFTTNESNHELRSLAETDTIIVDELTKFNIGKDQIERHSLKVDSNFTRWIYRVNVSPHLSKTHFHTSLHKRLHEMEVNTPARIYFPGKEMDIHLSYNNTVVRTIELQNDTSLVHKSSSAHILIYGNEPPSINTFELIEKFGEPIPLIIKINEGDLEEVERVAETPLSSYEHIAYWLGTEFPGNEQGKESLGMNGLSRLRQFMGQIYNRHSSGKLLYVDHSLPFKLSDIKSVLKSQNIDVYSIQDPLILEGNVGRTTYDQVIDEFKRRVFNGNTPTLLVEANPEQLRKLHKTLLQLKKQGLYVSSPEIKSY